MLAEVDCAGEPSGHFDSPLDIHHATSKRTSTKRLLQIIVKVATSCMRLHHLPVVPTAHAAISLSCSALKSQNEEVKG